MKKHRSDLYILIIQKYLFLFIHSIKMNVEDAVSNLETGNSD